MGKNVGQDFEAALPLIGAGVGSLIMPGVGTMVGMGLGSGLEGAIGGIQAGNQAQGYGDLQRDYLNLDAAARAKFIGEENNAYGPERQQLAQQAASPVPLNFGSNLGNINRQTLGAENNMAGVMAKRGMTGSGLEGSAIQGAEQGRVGELAEAFNKGMNARSQLGLNLLQHWNPLGEAQFGQGALPEQVGFGYGQQERYDKATQTGMQGLGTGLAGALNAWQNKPAGQPVTPAMPGNGYSGNIDIRTDNSQPAPVFIPNTIPTNGLGVGAGADWRTSPMLQDQSQAPLAMGSPMVPAETPNFLQNMQQGLNLPFPLQLPNMQYPSSPIQDFSGVSGLYQQPDTMMEGAF